MKKHVPIFPGQKEGEHIQLLVRKHWVTDFRSGFALLVIGGLPFFFGLWILIELWENSSTTIFWGATIGYIVYILFISLITYIHWLNDELDIIVVTEHRIISHEQVDLFHRHISETNVTQIEDVKGVEKGFFQNVFHYGALEVMTASNDVFFNMNYVDHPYENARRLVDIRDQSINAHHAR